MTTAAHFDFGPVILPLPQMERDRTCSNVVVVASQIVILGRGAAAVRRAAGDVGHDGFSSNVVPWQVGPAAVAAAAAIEWLARGMGLDRGEPGGRAAMACQSGGWFQDDAYWDWGAMEGTGWR